MKKQLLFLVLSLLFSSKTISAQKIDLDRFEFKASYLQLPTNPFPEEYTTFSTRFIANGINLKDAGYTNGENDLASVYFKIAGFKRVNTGGHFTIKVQVDGYDLGKAESVKKETKTKDKEGKEVITISYTMTLKYLVPMMYTITDLNGKILKDGPIADGNIAKTYESASFSTVPALEKFWTENSEAVKKGLLGGFMSEKLSLFQSRLDGEIGYIPRTNTDILWTTDSPKHPENDAFKKACADAKAAMSEMSSVVPLNLSTMKPILAYFDSVLVKYTKDEKPERKLRYGAWYNMAVIYYWLEDHDNAIRCAEGLIANDYDKSDGKDLKLAAERMKGQLANARIKTRHYVRDVSNATAPAISEFQNQEEEARKQILKDKAMQEAATREVATQQRSSSGSGMVDLDKTIGSVGNLLGLKKKERATNVDYDRGMVNMIISMNETLATYNLVKKTVTTKGCSQNATIELVSQFAKFKRQYFEQKEKFNSEVVNKMKLLIESYEKYMQESMITNYASPGKPNELESAMEYVSIGLGYDTNEILDLITRKDKDRRDIMLKLSELQKNLNYGTYGLYSDVACNQQTYEFAKSIFLTFRMLEQRVKISDNLKSEYAKIKELYLPMLRSEKNTIREDANTQLIEKINKNEYPIFILALLQSK